MTNTDAGLRSNISMLGQLLGSTIKKHLGDEFLDKIELIRTLSKSSRTGNEDDRVLLVETLQNLSDEELVPVSRAFSHFLNLANIAEQYHTISRYCDGDVCTPDPFQQLVGKLQGAGISNEQVREAAEALSIELVLTAHPTEISRRTLIHKHALINHCLEELELTDLTERERQILLHRVEELVSQAWHTNEIRQQRPTPVDEARWGFAVIEHSLWQAVPEYFRQLDKRLRDSFGFGVPLNAVPVKVASWMGGDRDGNPFVTAKVSTRVLLTSRRVATGLYLSDIQELTSELSMTDASDELLAHTENSLEPYRFLLRKLRSDLQETLQSLVAQLSNEDTEARELITTEAQLREPLELCYRSLKACGMDIIADGLLLDVLRRLSCFGLNLVRLDFRQDGERHTEVFSELTRHLGLGDYAEWSEEQRQAFLLQELANKRPLFPKQWDASDNVREVLDTCAVIAVQRQEAVGTYIISMASQPSDVLAVQLLLKDAGCQFRMPVAPLFETLDDLNGGAATMQNLLSIDWYRDYIGGHQEVMIGYSDSAKDASVLAAAWAQYRAQEELVEICESHDVSLTLFHGRGGTVGRGGAPAHAALLSQPPRSLKGGLRVTEQGEMIRFKFGLPKVALNSLNLYTTAILEANLLPPVEPKAAWRDVMDQLAEDSCNDYRGFVRGHESFVPYFRAATPEQELGKLPLGSRPAKRRADGGVESLRAIPWIFAWSQNRLMLPAWLGSGRAFTRAIDAGARETMQEMQSWPFFRTRLQMLEMVFTKADSWLSEYYDTCLVPEELWPLGQELRDRLSESVAVVLDLTQEHHLMENEPRSMESIRLRNPYTDPLNLLQAELLRRSRANAQAGELHPEVEQALMVTIAGVAAGMRNTG